jgi:hypothetical protein
MTPTGDVTGRIMTKIPDFIKATCGWTQGGIVGQAPPLSFHLPRDTVYHTVRVSFTPQPWMLLLVILPVAFLLLTRRPNAWQILRRLSERIELVRLPGLFTLWFGRSQTQGTRPKRPRSKGKKQGKKRTFEDHGQGAGIGPHRFARFRRARRPEDPSL